MGVTRIDLQLMIEWLTSMVWGHSQCVMLMKHTQVYIYTAWRNFTHSYPMSWLASLYIYRYNKCLIGLVKLKVKTYHSKWL